MNVETAKKVIRDIEWQINIQQRFLGQVRMVRMNRSKNAEFFLKGACWIDGTLETQIVYSEKKLAHLVFARERLLQKYH